MTMLMKSLGLSLYHCATLEGMISCFFLSFFFVSTSISAVIIYCSPKNKFPICKHFTFFSGSTHLNSIDQLMN